LHTPRGETYAFDGGATVVDFAHSGGEGRWAVFETLHHPRDLAAWLAEPPISLPRSLAVSADDLDAARRARGAFHALLAAAAHHRRAPRAALATVNGVAAVPPLVPRLGSAEPTGALARRWAAPVTVPAALSTLARELVDILTGPAAGEGRVRECASPDCALIFVDTSRSGARRWCSMERCGNRQKVRAYRQRSRE
jgi:predicted RNA-binding Zn ribbon-like protein